MPIKLWQVRFDLTGCYVSGVPLSAPVPIGDNIRIINRGDQGDCWAGVAVEAENDRELLKKEPVAEQTISEIANLYALVSGRRILNRAIRALSIFSILMSESRGYDGTELGD